MLRLVSRWRNEAKKRSKKHKKMKQRMAGRIGRTRMRFCTVRDDSQGRCGGLSSGADGTRAAVSSGDERSKRQEDEVSDGEGEEQE